MLFQEQLKGLILYKEFQTNVVDKARLIDEAFIG